MSKKQGTVQRYVLFFPYRDRSGGVYFRCDKQGKVYPDVMSVGIGGAAYRHCWQGRYNELYSSAASCCVWMSREQLMRMLEQTGAIAKPTSYGCH